MELEELPRFPAHLHLMQEVVEVDRQVKLQDQVEDQVVVAVEQKMQALLELMELQTPVAVAVGAATHILATKDQAVVLAVQA